MVEQKGGSGSRRQVLSGHASKTVGGLKKSDLTRNKQGKIVSKKKSAAAKKNPALQNWLKAVKKAKKNLDIDLHSFVPIKGKLLTEARKIYNK